MNSIESIISMIESKAQNDSLQAEMNQKRFMQFVDRQINQDMKNIPQIETDEVNRDE